MQNDINPANTLIVRRLGFQKYEDAWCAMRQFTDHRDENTLDECWLLQHFPVFTQGQNGKPEHVLNPGLIPIVQTDRGGQVTYHGPGQLMFYTLVDLKRKKMSVREFVSGLENIVIELLTSFKINAYAKPTAPGVYLTREGLEQKICSIGLRIRRGASYHGIALNVHMDLSPFDRINPCGFASLQMTQITAHTEFKDLLQVGNQLITYFTKKLGYTSAQYFDESELIDGNKRT